MGASSLAGMLEVTNHDAALHYHLKNNHYPPVGFMFDVCKEAIALAINGEHGVEIDLAGHCTWRGQDSAPVYAIIEQHHLEGFLEDAE